VTGDRCVLVRSGAAYEGRQGLTYLTGLTAASSGSRRLCLTSATLPPGTRSKAHLHEDVESAGYVIDGTLETLFGERLEHSVVAEAGDFVYIPAGIPHLVRNVGDSAARALIAHAAPDDQQGIVLLPELDLLVGG
jgi:uncharacterized RmlC-like cupin family protein